MINPTASSADAVNCLVGHGRLFRKFLSPEWRRLGRIDIKKPTTAILVEPSSLENGGMSPMRRGVTSGIKGICFNDLGAFCSRTRNCAFQKCPRNTYPPISSGNKEAKYDPCGNICRCHAWHCAGAIEPQVSFSGRNRTPSHRLLSVVSKYANRNALLHQPTHRLLLLRVAQMGLAREAINRAPAVVRPTTSFK